MAGYLAPLPTHFDDLTGAPLASGKVYTYLAGTTTPATTYSDQAMSVPNANPVILDASGNASIFIPDASVASYKFITKTSADATVRTIDGISVPATAAPPAPAAVPTGAILQWGGTTAPTSYLLCDGSAISRTTFAALFAAFGTIHGVGDGSTTFNIPDMRGRFAFGKAGAGTGSTLGGTFGAIDHVHTGAAHTHTVSGTTSTPSATQGDSQAGSGSAPAAGTHTHTLNVTSGAASAANTGTANPPALTLNFIVKT